MAAHGATRVLSLDVDTYDDVDQAVERIFDELAPPLEGRSVLLKPNMVLAWPPESGATTHPALVRACVREVKRRGGRPLVGDTPGSGYMYRAAKVARVTGIAEAAGDALTDIDREVVERELRTVGEKVPLCRAALDADVLITLPKLKTHALVALTGAVKNSYGLIAGGAKSHLHRVAPDPRRFAELVAEVYALRPADLAITDAVVAMQGNGPTTRDLRHVGKLLASPSAVAADAAAARLMGLEPEEVPFLAAAAGQGLGPISLEEIDLEGQIDPVAGFRVPATWRMGWITGLGSAVVSTAILERVSKPRLELRADRCTACGSCAEACPMGAITMEKRGGRRGAWGRRGARGRRGAPLPRLDQERCIACFCCMEQCPEEAWGLSLFTRASSAAHWLGSVELAALGDRIVGGALRRLGRG